MKDKRRERKGGMMGRKGEKEGGREGEREGGRDRGGELMKGTLLLAHNIAFS